MTGGRLGRRVRKTVSTYTSGAWVEDADGDRFFVYEGWTPVLELDANAGNATVRKFTWGLDISGTRQGAGGVGGLLATVETQGTTGTEDDDAYWYLYDANGNVGQVVAADGQTLAAHYEYDPYGNTIVAEGPYAAENPFRFSTKWHDAETGLYYYIFRYYAPRLGRWLNRDPIEEEGGLNLYGFLTNDPIAHIDPTGRLFDPLPWWWWFDEPLRPPHTYIGICTCSKRCWAIFGMTVWTATARFTTGVHCPITASMCSSVACKAACPPKGPPIGAGFFVSQYRMCMFTSCVPGAG